MNTPIALPTVTADDLLFGLTLLAPVLVVIITGIVVLLIDLVITDWLSRRPLMWIASLGLLVGMATCGLLWLGGYVGKSAFGGFLVAQQAARRMLPHGHGAILFTGASASVKGYAQSASFAMGKFALRGLAQSLARELSPRGIHVAHFVVDGGIRSERRPGMPEKPDALLDPDAIAASYWHVLQQPRSAWTWEMELRPWVENF